MADPNSKAGGHGDGDGAAKGQVAPKSADLASFAAAGASLEEQITAAVAAGPITVFVKPSCPFCVEVQRTFEGLGAPCATFDVGATRGLHAALKKVTGQMTVPYVFIGKEFIGGCDDTKALQRGGKLQHRLMALGLLSTPHPAAFGKPPSSTHPRPTGTPAMAPLPPNAIQAKGSAAVSANSRLPRAMFMFPSTVDDRAARLNGLWSFIVCVLVAVFYKRQGAHWLVAALLADFVMRLICAASPLASLSNLICAMLELFGSTPKWIAGPPKQFAALCGVMFSAGATLFYFLRPDCSNCVYVGLAFTIGLAGACALEAFAGVCLGCIFFRIMVDLGLVAGEIYSLHLNTRSEVDYTWKEANKRLREGPPSRHTRHVDPEQPTAIDISYKAETDDMTREDFDPIRHVKITHWSMHASLAALAVAWKLASYPATLNTPNTVWHVLGIASAAFYVTFAALYIVRAIRFPGKICKEWACNLRGNSFVLPLLCLPLYAFLINDWSHKFAQVLFWAGAGPSMALSMLRVGGWVSARKEVEHISAAWLLLPVANLVAAFMGAFLNDSYANAMQFWFAFGLMLWLLLFPITFYKAIIHTDNDDRLRPLLALWPATPAIAALAYLSVYSPPGSWGSVLGHGWSGASNNFIFINLYWFSVALFLVALVLFHPCPYFARTKFEFSYWAAGFPTVAICMAAQVYNLLKPGRLSLGIACASLAIASGANAMLLLATLSSILRRGVFVPDYKWGPLSFMRLTHEAIRGAMGGVLDTLEAVNTLASGAGAQADGKGAAGSEEERARGVQAMAMSLVGMWEELEWVHAVHSFHEDEIIFSTYEDYFPGVASGMQEQHTQFPLTLLEVAGLLQQLLDTTTAGPVPSALLQSLNTKVPAAMKALEEHLREEEDHLQPVPRRYLPLAVHKEVVRAVFHRTPAPSWFKMLPWVVNNLPMLPQRVRFLKTLLWALPERSQQLGFMLALGVDPVQWRRITDELPELIPRGAEGWERYY